MSDNLIENGDVFYAKTVKTGVDANAKLINLKGHAIGILLGVIPGGGTNLSVKEVSAVIGAIGLVKFDDVKEALGEEQVKAVLKHVEAKYK